MSPRNARPRRGHRGWLAGFACLVLVLFGTATARAATEASADSAFLSEVARGLAPGQRLRVEKLFLEAKGEVALELERFRVFAEDASILAGDVAAAIPDTAYFRGRLSGEPGSRVVLGFKTGGVTQGLITSGDEVWSVSSRGRGPGLGSRRLAVLEEFEDRPFECLSDSLPRPEDPFLESLDRATSTEPLAAAGYSYSARVAIETDWEFLQKFSGNVTAATDYVADLFAFSSAIYEDEVATSLYISYLQWWPGGSAGVDPWTQSGCAEALGEFRSYWLANRGSVERTIAHFLSGKNTGCGIAYLSALCSSSSGYGVSGSLTAGFDPDNPLSSSAFWDILVVSHEIGHNFGSHHTHCYAGVLGNPNPVDQCYSGDQIWKDGQWLPCYEGPMSLPGCSPGGRCGTIMSYCHLRTGGYGNIALTFGEDHPYGDDPWRVPSMMSSHVASRAGSYPTCLSPVVITLFEDGFDTGDTSAWSAVQP